MVRKLLSLLLLLIGVAGLRAQELPPVQQLTPLPLNPKVKTGVLSNGLTYYILHNEEPKERANFYIAQKVGSTLETKDQLGLAHFLEHMAFNGTENYPGNSLLNYLQGKGIRFGADINAYTGFDETVYNINNVPTTDKNLMDSVLLALRDWSTAILLETDEIEAERGIIQEEWRSRNTAELRIFSAILPQIYEEYQYHQLPIGSMDVVMNFNPDVLRDYYHKWYRPDQQGIIIVGDFDANEMEAKVKDLFSKIEMPKGAPKRVFTPVSDNKAPIYASMSDPELREAVTMISFKSDVLPPEYRSTVEMYLFEDLMKLFISSMINQRLIEYGQNPECSYSQAAVNFGDFYVSKTKEAFDIVVTAKNDIQKAVDEAMSIVARACKTGFTYSEFERAKDQIFSQVEKQYNERDKTNNNYLGTELYKHFLNNTPSPGIENVYQLMSQVLPTFPLEAVNEVSSQILTPNNMVVVSYTPSTGFELLSEQTMIGTIQNAMNATYEPYVDEVITDPMIETLPKPGTITDISENSELGITVYTLSNGVKVVLKSTDFAGDQILMAAYRPGGKQIYAPEEAPNVQIMDLVFEISKFGPFDQKALNKYLAGKNVSLHLTIDNTTDVLSGSSTVKDLPTLMELIYTGFTNLNPDQSAYDAQIQKVMVALQNAASNPEYIFSKNYFNTIYGGNPLMTPPTVETIEQADYLKALEMDKAVMKNAAEYTFFFVGNVDKATIRPLLEQYIATLPVSLRKKLKVITPINTVDGQVENTFKQPMQTPATWVYDLYSGTNEEYNAKNVIMINLVGDILTNIFIETLREEEGGIYTPSVESEYDEETGKWNVKYSFITNADAQKKLIDRAHSEWEKLLKEGTDMVNFNKVKEAAVKQYEISVNKNNYWLNALVSQFKYPDVPIIIGYGETLQNLTLDEFNNFLKNLYNGKDRVQVIMEGVQAE